MIPKWGEGTWTFPLLAARVVFGLALGVLILGAVYLIEVLS